MARRGRKSRGRKIGSKSPKVELAQEEEALVRFVNLKIDSENVSDAVNCLLDVAGGDWQSLGRREETSPPFWAGLNLEGQEISAATLKGYQETIKKYFRACIATKGSGKSKASVPDTVQHPVFEKLSRCRLRYNFETGRWSPAILSQEEMDRIRSEDLVERAGEMMVRDYLARMDRTGLPGLLPYFIDKIPFPPQNIWVTQCFDLTIQTAPTLAQFLTHYAACLRECRGCHLIFLSKKYNKVYCTMKCQQEDWEFKRKKEGYHAKWMRERRDPDSPKFDAKYVR